MSEATQPTVVVIGGQNGAGKTTPASLVLPRELHLRQFVNADAIALGLSGFSPESVALQASRIMLRRLEELATLGQDFAFETTLSALTFRKLLLRLQSEGYAVKIVYVWFQSPDLSVARVAERGRRGGHHIPEDVIRRRYGRGVRNFADLYRPLADAWILCDNSGSERIVVARGGRDVPTEVLDREVYDEFERCAAAQRNGSLED